MNKGPKTDDIPPHLIETKCSVCFKYFEMNGVILISNYRRCAHCQRRICEDCAYILNRIEWLCPKQKCRKEYATKRGIELDLVRKGKRDKNNKGSSELLSPECCSSFRQYDSNQDIPYSSECDPSFLSERAPRSSFKPESLPACLPNKYNRAKIGSMGCSPVPHETGRQSNTDRVLSQTELGDNHGIHINQNSGAISRLSRIGQDWALNGSQQRMPQTDTRLDSDFQFLSYSFDSIHVTDPQQPDHFQGRIFITKERDYGNQSELHHGTRSSSFDGTNRHSSETQRFHSLSPTRSQKSHHLTVPSPLVRQKPIEVSTDHEARRSTRFHRQKTYIEDRDMNHASWSEYQYYSPMEPNYEHEIRSRSPKRRVSREMSIVNPKPSPSTGISRRQYSMESLDTSDYSFGLSGGRRQPRHIGHDDSDLNSQFNSPRSASAEDPYMFDKAHSMEVPEMSPSYYDYPKIYCTSQEWSRHTQSLEIPKYSSEPRRSSLNEAKLSMELNIEAGNNEIPPRVDRSPLRNPVKKEKLHMLKKELDNLSFEDTFERGPRSLWISRNGAASSAGASSDDEEDFKEALNRIPGPNDRGHIAVRIQRHPENVCFTLLGAHGLKLRSQPISGSIIPRAYAIACCPPYEQNQAYDTMAVESTEPYWDSKWRLPIPNDELMGSIFDIFVWDVELANTPRTLMGVASVSIKTSNYCDKIRWLSLVENFEDEVDRSSSAPKRVSSLNGSCLALDAQDMQVRPDLRLGTENEMKFQHLANAGASNVVTQQKSDNCRKGKTRRSVRFDTLVKNGAVVAITIYDTMCAHVHGKSRRLCNPSQVD